MKTMYIEKLWKNNINVRVCSSIWLSLYCCPNPTPSNSNNDYYEAIESVLDLFLKMRKRLDIFDPLIIQVSA